MSDELTRGRTLESLKKEAKQWLGALRQDIGAARERLHTAFPTAPANPTLRDVQHALAREHGFPGWAALKHAVESHAARRATAVGQFEEKASALLEAYRTGTPEAMARHWARTWHRRDWRGMRTYVQLDLGRQAGSAGIDDDITLDDARYLVAREHGFESWAALERQCAVSPPAGRATEPRLMTDDLVEELCRRDPGLRQVDLTGSRITDRALAALATLEDLESVAVGWTAITDAGVAHLARAARLRSVDLQGTSTGNAALRALAGKENLAHLRTGNAVTDEGVAILHEYPVFAAWRGGDVEIGLTSDEPSPNLLLLRGRITDRGMRHLTGLDGLFGLNIADVALSISPAGLAPLTTLSNLGWLALEASDESMAWVARMPRLRFLGCQDTVAGDDGFEALAQSGSLEKIWGRRCHNLRSRGFRALARMPALRALSVSCLNVPDEAVATLPAFPALRELMPMDIPDAGYRHIGRCTNLESLVLMYCRETGDAATEEITGLPKLRKYFASYTRATDRTPELLASIQSLESVTFDGCGGLTNAGIAALARLPRLNELRISGRQLTGEVAGAFGPQVSLHYST